MPDEALDQRRREFTSKVVNLIMADDAFRSGLVENTKGTLVSAGLWYEYYDVLDTLTGPDVSGYMDEVEGGGPHGDSGCCGSNY